MPQLLREIKKARWLRQADNDPLPASALRDMQVDDKRRLSVWLLPDGDSRSAQLRRTIVALTIKGRHCERFEFALVASDVLDQLGIIAISTPGNTVDSVVNANHRDIEDPGVDKLAKLTLQFIPQDVVLERDVGQMITDSVKTGDLARATLPDEIDTKLVKWGYLDPQS